MLPITVATPDLRARILDASLEVLRTEGYQRFTQTRVARKAKLRQSHLTYYFPTRAELLEATAERHLDAVVGHIARAAQAKPGWGTGPLLGTMAGMMTDPTHMRMFIAMMIEGDRDPVVHQIILRASARVRSAIAEALGGGPDAERRARTIQTVLWGLGLHSFAHRPSAESDPTNDVLDLLEEFAR